MRIELVFILLCDSASLNQFDLWHRTLVQSIPNFYFVRWPFSILLYIIKYTESVMLFYCVCALTMTHGCDDPVMIFSFLKGMMMRKCITCLWSSSTSCVLHGQYEVKLLWSLVNNFIFLCVIMFVKGRVPCRPPMYSTYTYTLLL